MPNFDAEQFRYEATSILHTSWGMQMPSAYLAFNTIHAIYPCRWKPPFHASNFIISLDRSSLSSVVPGLLDCKDPVDELASCHVQLQTKPFNFADLEPPVPASAWFAQYFFSRYQYPRYTDQVEVPINQRVPVFAPPSLYSFSYTITEGQYFPLIAAPTELASLFPELSSCRPFSSAPFQRNNYRYRGILDPPVVYSIANKSPTTPSPTALNDWIPPNQAAPGVGVTLDGPVKTLSPDYTTEKKYSKSGSDREMADMFLEDATGAAIRAGSLPAAYIPLLDGQKFEPGRPTIRNPDGSKWVFFNENMDLVFDNGYTAKMGLASQSASGTEEGNEMKEHAGLSSEQRRVITEVHQKDRNALSPELSPEPSPELSPEPSPELSPEPKEPRAKCPFIFHQAG
jgi:hypothetical protein